MAEEWIKTHQEAFDKGEAVTFAITLKPDGMLIGAIGIHINKTNRLGEMGYWIGKPYWNQGYCTEAAKEVVRYAFEVLDLEPDSGAPYDKESGLWPCYAESWHEV